MGGEPRGKSGPLPAPAAASRSEAEEEKQMEEFFGLLKSIRDMKNRRRDVGGCSTPRKKARFGRPSQTAWTPSFRWEDFAGVATSSEQNGSTADRISSDDGGGRKEEKGEQRNLDTLDLNLPL